MLRKRSLWRLAVLLFAVVLVVGCGAPRSTPTAVALRPSYTPEPGPPLPPTPTEEGAGAEAEREAATAAIRAFMLDPNLALTYVSTGVHSENSSMAVEEYESADRRFLVETATHRVVYMHITTPDWAAAAEPVIAADELARRAYQIAVAQCPCFVAAERKLEYKPGGKGANLFFRWQLPKGDPSRPLDQPALIQVGLATDGTFFDYIDSGICYIPADAPDYATPTPLPSETPLPTRTSTPPDLATPTPLPPDTYLDWSTYTNDRYGFFLLYPAEWTLEEDQGPDSTMAGHSVHLWPNDQTDMVLRINFKATSEDRFIGRTGVGAGEIVERGSVSFLGEPIARHVLVAQEKDLTVLYAGGRVIERGDLAFTLYLDYGGDLEHAGLTEAVQLTADRIVASVALK